MLNLHLTARKVFRTDIPGVDETDSISNLLTIVESGVVQRFSLKLDAIHIFAGTGVEQRTGRSIGLGERLRSGVVGRVRLKIA